MSPAEEAKSAKQNARSFGDIVDAYRRYQLAEGKRYDRARSRIDNIGALVGRERDAYATDISIYCGVVHGYSGTSRHDRVNDSRKHPFLADRAPVRRARSGTNERERLPRFFFSVAAFAFHFLLVPAKRLGHQQRQLGLRQQQARRWPPMVDATRVDVTATKVNNPSELSVARMPELL